MINIYFASKRLTISSAATGGMQLDFDPSTPISRSILMALLDRHHNLTLRCSDEAAGYRAVASLFVEVLAAGGVVQNDNDEVLMIHRNGRYDLPKGHWEEGESIESCAVREVMEETGVEGVTLGEKICVTYHSYYMNNRWELKATHWYAMRSSFAATLTPQTEEGIDSAKWIAISDLDNALNGSFSTIKSVIAAFRELI